MCLTPLLQCEVPVVRVGFFGVKVIVCRAFLAAAAAVARARSPTGPRPTEREKGDKD